MTIDGTWLRAQIATVPTPSPDSPGVSRLRELLKDWTVGFAAARADVASPTVAWPRRGLLEDESTSFLRALDSGFIMVDGAGFVVLPTVRPKTPGGRYALLSKSGTGVSINLEYLIQIGATAELVLDHGWKPADIDFERGEFDAVGVGSHDRPWLVMEAKARVTGPDSLEKLVTTWLTMVEDPHLDTNNNAGRKYRELQRLCQSGRVVVWLVAEGARWTMSAAMEDGTLRLTSAADPTPLLCRQTCLPKDELMHESLPYDATYHHPNSVAAAGHCSQHGPDSCSETPIISFQDRHDRWQSGCQRALDELVARGEVSPPRTQR